MRIGVLEWDISAMGGRHRTMMAFADYLVERGHDVTFLSDFAHPEPSRGWTDSTFLKWFPFRHLEYRHFDWSVRDRHLVPPDSWKQFDVLLCSYGHWGYLQSHLPNTKVITWVIHPEQAHHQGADHRVWTNSHTSLIRLLESKNWQDSCPTIVHPPHDYSPWRRAAKPLRDRGIDVVIVGSLLYDKGILEGLRTAVSAGLTVNLLGTTWHAAQAENVQILSELERIKAQRPGRINITLNAPYLFVADVMGRSKTYLSMSRAESCSLAVYEAMNAGCQIVARNVGAAVEQTGGLGLLFEEGQEAPDLLRSACHRVPTYSRDLINRGRLFDRTAIGHETDDALR